MSPSPFAERVLTASTTLFLLVAPFTASAGWRSASLIVGCGCVAFLLLRGHLEIPRPLPRALLAALAAGCALAVASLAWSVDRALTLGELRGQVLYGALAFATFYAAADARRWRAWWVAILAGALVLFAAESLRAAVEPRLGLREWDGGGGAFSTHLVLLAPLLLPLAWSERGEGPGRVAMFVAALLLLFAAAWNTENRIVWPALLAAFATAALARRYASHAGPRLRGARYLAAAAVLLIVTLAALNSGVRMHVDSSPRAGGLVGIGADVRPQVWRVAADEIRRAPLLGHGFGREISAGAFKPVTPREIQHPEILHAHNVFVNVALQLGLAGVALFAAILLLLGREFANALRSRESCAAGILGLALLAGFVAKNLTDDFFYRHNGLVFWALMGALLGLARRESRR